MCKQIGPDNKIYVCMYILSAWRDRIDDRGVSVTVTVWRFGYSLFARICRYKYIFGVVWNPLRILFPQLAAQQNDTELTTR